MFLMPLLVAGMVYDIELITLYSMLVNNIYIYIYMDMLLVFDIQYGMTIQYMLLCLSSSCWCFLVQFFSWRPIPI